MAGTVIGKKGVVHKTTGEKSLWSGYPRIACRGTVRPGEWTRPARAKCKLCFPDEDKK